MSVPQAAAFRRVAALVPPAGGSISGVAWNPAGTLVATSDQNGSTYVWQVPADRLALAPLTAPGAGNAYYTAFSPGGGELATGYQDGSVDLWSVPSGRLIAAFTQPSGGQVDTVAFSPNGGTLATCGFGSPIYLWNVAHGNRPSSPEASLPAVGGKGAYTVAFGSRGLLATGSFTGTVQVWDVGTRTVTAIYSLPGGSAVSALAFDATGGLLAAGDKGGNGYVWNLARGSGAPVAAPPGSAIWGMSFRGTGTLAMADKDGDTYLWRVSPVGPAVSLTGTLPDPSPGRDGVGALAFSPAGGYLATGDTNGRAYLWRAG